MRPYFLGPMGGLKLEGPLYTFFQSVGTSPLSVTNTLSPLFRDAAADTSGLRARINSSLRGSPSKKPTNLLKMAITIKCV